MKGDTDRILKAKELFQECFGYSPTNAAAAPGRVNLIGEHTDYNDGFVLPFALPYTTIVVGAVTKEKKSTVYSVFNDNLSKVEFVADKSLKKGEPTWANYVKGTVFQYLPDLPAGFAFDAVVVSNVPVGSGLSSSAALEVAVATFLEDLCSLNNVSGVTKALRCQKAEHTFAGTPCGIMDQYISAMGQENNLLLLDCRSNEFELVPFGGDSSMNNPVIVVTNSNVKHELTGSEYPDRVRQCKHAVEVVLQKYPNVKALRDVRMDMLNSVKDNLPEVVYKRAHHCVKEDIRTLSTVESLKRNDFAAVGKLMTESHISLKEDYEVSCAELDLLVDLALQVPGVYGSRMTGGGFGGCTVTLVDRNSAPTLKKFITDKYLELTGNHCDCYIAKPSPGARKLSIPSSNRPAWWDWAVPLTVTALAVGIAVTVLSRKNN